MSLPNSLSGDELDFFLKHGNGNLHKVDAESLNNLIQQYDKALEDNFAKKEEYQKFKDDYLKLKRRLKSLPEKLEYEAMVPLCSKALCPGKIIHTNEILCLLGDNWFVECTSKKAAEIVSHRLKSIDETLNRLDKERELYNSWTFEAERQMVESLGEGTIEIIEDYEEDKEEEWRKQHRESVRRHHQQLAQSRQSKPVDEKNDTDLWTRLDALELEEEFMEVQVAYEENRTEYEEKNRNNVQSKIRQRADLDLLDIIHPQRDDDDDDEDDKRNFGGKKVTFSPENIIHNIADLNLKDSKKKVKDGEESERKEPVELYKPSETSEYGMFDPIFIRFRHGDSSQVVQDSEEQHNEESDDEDDSDDDDSYQLVISPGDIYEQFGPPSLEAKTLTVPGANKAPLKSILKTQIMSTEGTGGDGATEVEVPIISRKESRKPKFNRTVLQNGDAEALESKVMERVPNPNSKIISCSSNTPPPLHQPVEKTMSARPMSLFKKRKQGLVTEEVN